ncbi:MAG: hypothetical protein IKW08_08335 [Roseburia sp.]|nr:hypothetical protein [Roseburia sp.]
MVNILARFLAKKDSKKDFSRWYSKRIKEYENIINMVEQNVGTKSVCEKRM